MITRIYWFSGTGNSYWIANQLRDNLGEGDLCSISGGAWRDMPPPDRAVVVYPAFAGRLPLIVQQFLRDVALTPETDIHLVANFALWRAGALHVARDILKRRKLRIRTGFAVRMPNNYTPFGKALPEEKQQALFRDAAGRLQEIAQIIKDPMRRAWEGDALTGWLWSLLNAPMIALNKNEDRKFNTDENCNACGICAKICPVNNIEIRDKRPVWLGRCEQCFRCLQYCPQESIQYKRATVGRKRYHHPAVPVATWQDGEL